MDTPAPPVGSGEIFSLLVRVYYEDTDFGGVVYYANYLKYMERARTEFLRSLGYDQGELLTKDRRQFVVKSADINFNAPARFDDVSSVTAEVKKIRRASLHFTQLCRLVTSSRVAHSGGKEATESNNIGGDLVASAEVVIACLDADSFKPCAVPGSLKMVLNP